MIFVKEDFCAFLFYQFKYYTDFFDLIVTNLMFLDVHFQNFYIW